MILQLNIVFRLQIKCKQAWLQNKETSDRIYSFDLEITHLSRMKNVLWDFKHITIALINNNFH